MTVNNLHGYVHMGRKLKLWKSGPSSLRSWSSASWRRRAVWRRRRRPKVRSSSKSKPSTIAAWPIGRWGHVFLKKCVRACRRSVRLYDCNDSQAKMSTLEAQVKQLGLQGAQDCERLAKDRVLTLQLLHKVS